MIPNIKLTALQRLWLMTKGGRGLEDVFISKGRKFIYVGSLMIYVPDDLSIKIAGRADHKTVKEIGVIHTQSL